MRKIFISYSTDDRDKALPLKDGLEPFYEVFMDFTGIPGGTEWEREIESAIRESDVFLLVVTQRSTESEWVTRETLFADHLDKPCIPALFEGDMPFRIINLQYIDFRDSFESPFLDLLEAIQIHAPVRSRNVHEADQFVGQAARARLDGDVQLSRKLLKQAFSIDTSIEKYKGKFWAGLADEIQKIDLTKFRSLSIVEKAKERSTSVYNDKSTFDWSLQLEGERELLRLVDNVEYTLHPTFSPVHQIVRSRKNGFKLSQVGWGTFLVGIKINLTNSQYIEGAYNLTFEKKSSVLLSDAVP